MSIDHRPKQTAIRTDLSATFVSRELSRSVWLITSLSPGIGKKMSKHCVRSGDVAELLARFAHLSEKARVRTGQIFPITVIQEAGFDGFWIHHVLRREGIESYVVDPGIATATSVDRRWGSSPRPLSSNRYSKPRKCVRI